MTRLRLLIVLISLVVSQAAVGETKERNPRFMFGAGAGLQYAGYGLQFNLVHHRHRGSFTVGLPSVGLGYDYAVTDKVSIGASVFAITLAQGGSLNINYHYTSAFTRGWMVGLDLFESRIAIGDTKAVGAFISVGFKN